MPSTALNFHDIDPKLFNSLLGWEQESFRNEKYPNNSFETKEIEISKYPNSVRILLYCHIHVNRNYSGNRG